MTRRLFASILMVFWFLITCVNAQAQVLAFPGAEGFGRFAKGGRGGRVIEVTNLNDSGPGSLRAAMEASGARTVIFRVGGTIELTTNTPGFNGTVIGVTNDFLTVAGHTAPGDGIVIKGGEIFIRASDVIIRHLRVRPGFATIQHDGFTLFGTNIILDHCSVSWATDEGISMIGGSNLTVQWCTAVEGLFGNGRASQGIFIRGLTQNTTIHHNYMANNNNRNPLAAGDGGSSGPQQIVDFVNNFAVYGTGRGTSQPKNGPTSHNWVGNGWIPHSLSNRKLNGSIRTVDAGTGIAALSFIYLEGNIGPTRQNNTLAESAILDVTQAIPQVGTRLGSPPVLPSETDAFQAYIDVLAKAGATVPIRDTIDQRVIDKALTGTFLPNNIQEATTTFNILANESEVGGYPVYKSGTPPTDTDHDGMPDSWEIAQGFNPNNDADGPQDADGDGYTNVEEYLNELAAGAAPPPGDTSPPAAPGNLRLN